MPTDISAGMIPYSSLPEYQRPLAATQHLTYTGDAGSAGHVVDDNTIGVDNRQQFVPSVAAHELQHQIQNRAGGQTPVNMQAAMASKAAWNAIYGLTGLNKATNISSLNDEQQAEIPRTYMEQYAQAVKAKDPKAVDRLNAQYARPVAQVQAQAANGINTTPAPPGAPPAALTGIAVPLPGMMSKQTMSAPLTPFQHLAMAAHNVLGVVNK
jgi:hypothetical protein